MGVQSIRCTLPFFARAEVKQTKCSRITRITAVGLGGIALLVGILVLSGIPGLQALGTTCGWSLFAIGIVFLLVGICLKRTASDGHSNSQTHNVNNDRSSNSQFNARTNMQQFPSFLDKINPEPDPVIPV